MKLRFHYFCGEKSGLIHIWRYIRSAIKCQNIFHRLLFSETKIQEAEAIWVRSLAATEPADLYTMIRLQLTLYAVVDSAHMTIEIYWSRSIGVSFPVKVTAVLLIMALSKKWK